VKEPTREHQAGQIVFGRYLLERPLGRGGMGSVWSAVDRKLRRQVAVKLLAPDYAASEGALQRFEREAMLVAQLHSPYIVQIFDYGIDYRAPFMVMELLTGEDLRTRLRRVGRLPLRDLSRIIAQLAMGLGEAHAVGLIHRDLKPGNVFLTRSRTGEVVKVLDFGVAKGLGESMAMDEASELTAQGSLVGTPSYMSPEQVRTLPDIDHRADLWSLGVIIYRALTGHLPFKGKTTNDLSVNICTAQFPLPSTIVPDIPQEVDAFMSTALSSSPALRFGSAKDLAEVFLRIASPSHMGMSLDEAALSTSFAGFEGPSSSSPPGLPSYTPPPSGSYSGIGMGHSGISGLGVQSGSSRSSSSSIATSPRASEAPWRPSGTLATATLEGESLLVAQRRSWRRRAAIGAGAVALVTTGIVVGVALSGDTETAARPAAAPPAPTAVAASAPSATASATASASAAATAAPEKTAEKTAKTEPGDKPAKQKSGKPGGGDDPDIFSSRR
jgi:eukaryotic-like serine/threonine-protein kinase